jgi:hypothetical protein
MQAAQVAADLAKEDVKWMFCTTGMDAFVQNPDTQKSPVDYYHEGGLTVDFKEPDHGHGTLARRAATAHEYLRVANGPYGKPVARMRIFDTCEKLIETFPMLPVNPDKREEVLPCAIDHWYDSAIGYGMQSRHPFSEVPTRPAIVPGTMADILNHHQVLDEEERESRR